MAQELHCLLPRRCHVALAGDTLSLHERRLTMTLTDREVIDPDRPLKGTRWVLDDVPGDTVLERPGRRHPTGTDDREQQMDVEAGWRV